MHVNIEYIDKPALQCAVQPSTGPGYGAHDLAASNRVAIYGSPESCVSVPVFFSSARGFGSCRMHRSAMPMQRANDGLFEFCHLALCLGTRATFPSAVEAPENSVHEDDITHVVPGQPPLRATRRLLDQAFCAKPLGGEAERYDPVGGGLHHVV